MNKGARLDADFQQFCEPFHLALLPAHNRRTPDAHFIFNKNI